MELNEPYSRVRNNLQLLLSLGRNHGVHLLLQSTNSIETALQPLLNYFELRVALKLPEEVAMRFIGTTKPAELPPYGHCYTNMQSGENQHSTQIWRIPLVTTESVKKYLPKLKGWCESTLDGTKHIDRDPVIYSENEVSDKFDLRSIYNEYSNLVFDNLSKETNRRIDLFNKYSVDDLKSYNKLIIEGKGRDEDTILPQITSYVDEFIAMYPDIARKALCGGSDCNTGIK